MAPSYLCYLMCLMASPCLALLLHAFFTRIFHRVNPSLSPLLPAALSVLAGYPVMGIFLWRCHFRFLDPHAWFFPAAYALIVYTCLSFCYFILFTMTETARRIHILRRLHEKGPLTIDDLAAEYDATDMLSMRLDRMVALTQLDCIQGRYFLKARLLWFAGIVLSLWARLLGFFKKEDM